jgi:hypothetical protein
MGKSAVVQVASGDKSSIMKKLALAGLLIGTFAVGLVAGIWGGAWWSARIFSRMMYSKPEIEQAFLAAEEAEWAALLRLNEKDAALKQLENSIAIRLATIASWESVAPADEQTRKARDRFLTSAKVYSQSYPITDPENIGVVPLLSAVPGRNPASTCKNGICRLDDLRLAKLSGTTNSPHAENRSQ